MTEIAGKVAVVTGGGSGIGRSLALALAKEGARVVIGDIIKENGEAVAAEITKSGGSALALSCDVCDRASVRQMKADANKAFGKVALLFANAGATSLERLTDMPDNDVDWIIQVNLMGVTHCMQAFLPDMIAARDGHVMATASMAGMIPNWIPSHAPYSAAKMGIMGMMLNLREELAAHNVGATVYCPGGVQGGLLQNNERYRPMRFGGPRNVPLKMDPKDFEKMQLQFLSPDYVAPMVMLAVKKNRPIVVDHADQRQVFMDLYVKPVLEAFDDVEAFERSV